MKNIGEFELISNLEKRIKYFDPTVKFGIGDDAAVVHFQEGDMVVSSDMLVEGHHFMINKIEPYQLGHKALAVSLSDIAAMGAKPLYALISVAWSPRVSLEYAEGIYEGLCSLALKYGVAIIGGDTVKANELIIDVTVIGRARVFGNDKNNPGEACAKCNNIITRKGAKVGDVIAVTGRIGASGAGLLMLLSDDLVKGPLYDELVQAHLEPLPRVAESELIVRYGPPSAMIDVSDGLASEIHHICNASSVGAMIYQYRIPVDDSTKKAAGVLGKDYIQLALYSGEDYELIFTCSKDKINEIEHALKDMKTNVSVIGEICEVESGIKIDGKPLEFKGYDHFR